MTRFAPLSVPALLVVAVCLVPIGEAAAHDYWIQPAAFSADEDSSIPVHLFVGARGDVSEHPYRRRFPVRFDVVGAAGASLEPGPEHARPAASLRTDSDGIYTLVLQSNHSFIRLAAEKFERYLRHERLTSVIDERRRRDESGRAGLESYFRNCKSLVKVGAGTRGFDRVVGLPFEITAKTNPFAIRGGDTMRFAVSFEGKPLAGAYIELMSLGDLDTKLGGFTDDRGNVDLRIPRAGKWMVASTRMRRAPRGVAGDWESLWSSLTFEVADSAR